MISKKPVFRIYPNKNALISAGLFFIFYVHFEAFGQLIPIIDSTHVTFYSFKDEKKDIHRYFRSEPINRPLVLLSIINKKIEKRKLARVMGSIYFIRDMEKLSGVEFTYAFSIKYHWVGVEAVWYNFEKLDYQLKLWEKALKNQTYLNTSNEPYYTTYEDIYNYHFLIDTYVKNPPDRRIDFIETNLNYIRKELLVIFQMDLDAIFEVKTPKIVTRGEVNEGNFAKAKEIWMSKVNAE